MGRKKIRIGTRPSNLALRQVEEIINLLNGEFEFEIIEIMTRGDRDKITPISDVEGSDFFTDEIEGALLNKKIDIGVHSAKDLPDIIPPFLSIISVLKSVSPYDVLVSKNNLRIEELPENSRIGTSSKRRKEQIKKIRPDLQLVDVRGNIEERLKLIDEGLIDALIVAEAALIRLGLQNGITERLDFEIMKPHPLQGSLAVETRENEYELIGLFNKFDIRKKLLFVCGNNYFLGHMAEAITNHFFWQKFFALSISLNQKGIINPLILKVMREIGLDISNYKCRGYSELQGIEFDYFIVLERFENFKKSGKIEWNIELEGEKTFEFYRKIRDEIFSRIEDFYKKNDF